LADPERCPRPVNDREQGHRRVGFSGELMAWRNPDRLGLARECSVYGLGIRRIEQVALTGQKGKVFSDVLSLIGIGLG